jgi:hypothetical protein
MIYITNYIHTYMIYITNSICTLNRVQAVSQLRAVARLHAPCVQALVVLARLQEVCVYVCVYVRVCVCVYMHLVCLPWLY